jgi:hypothetical protein
MKTGAISFFLSIVLSVSALAGEGWKPMFNGENLEGWVQRNGTAKYFVQDDMIVGEAVLNSPNSFLCSEQHYGDFILELEVLVAPDLNSGIQFRSHSNEEYRSGRVHGYQCEIDPSPRAYSGGIYDEARRGWLSALGDNEKGRQAFHIGFWNHYRIEAIGNSLRTWVNGVNCANVADDMDASGFIALQVHGIGSKAALEGAQVRWKNIMIKTSDLEGARWPMDPDVREESYLLNALSENEVNKGWRLLWDGKSAAGWRSADGSPFPETGWTIDEGILTVQKGGGSIITEEKFGRFELVFDFKITDKANSGLKYFVKYYGEEGKGSALGLEYQIIDDKNYGQELKPAQTTGSLYDLIPAENLTIKGSRKPYKDPGNWNRARIIVEGDHVEHWLNEAKVVDFDRQSQAYRTLVSLSKFKDREDFGSIPEGHILIQDHGHTAYYKNLKIREF